MGTNRLNNKVTFLCAGSNMFFRTFPTTDPLQNWLIINESEGTCENLMVTVRQTFHTDFYLYILKVFGNVCLR